MKKTKFQEMLEKTKEKLKAQEETSGGSNSKTNREYTPFFNPNKILKTQKKVIARVLPIQSSDTFYVTYPNHRFMIGSNFFSSICAHSEFNGGKKFGNCPICNFLKDNNGAIEKNIYGKLMARDMHLCYVWNYDEKRIEKFNFDNNILGEIVEYLIDNDITEDSDGFDISFGKTEDGKWYMVKGVRIPEINIDDFMEENSIDEIPNIIDTELSFSSQFVVKRLRDTLSLAVQSFLPNAEDDGLDLSALHNSTAPITKKSRDEEENDEEELFEDKKNKSNKTTKNNSSKKVNKEEDNEDIDEFDSMFDNEDDDNNTNKEEDPF